MIAQVQRPYDQPDSKPPLTVGLFVDAEIKGREVSDAVVLPRAALQSEEGHVHVISADGRLAVRQVEVLRLLGEEAYVVGLSIGGTGVADTAAGRGRRTPRPDGEQRGPTGSRAVKRLVSWFAINPVATNLLVAFVLFAGVASFTRIPVQIWPDLNVPAISIVVPYLGAAPEEVETAVCARIDEKLDGIDGIDRVRSTAEEGRCRVSGRIACSMPTGHPCWPTSRTR